MTRRSAYAQQRLDNARAKKKRARLRRERVLSENTYFSKAGAVIHKSVDPIEAATRPLELVKLMRLWNPGAVPAMPASWKATQFRLLGMSRASGLRAPTWYD